MMQCWRHVVIVEVSVQLIQLEMLALIAPDLWPPDISDLSPVD